MAHKNGYDVEFKERLYQLREEEGMELQEALDTVFEENPKFKRKYRKRLDGRAGKQRASAILASMRKTKDREEENEVVWCFSMTNNQGTTVSNERLPDDAARRLLAALDLPQGSV
jgi:hypothetical protein